MFQVRNVFKTSARQPNQLTKRQHNQIKGLAQHLVNECRSRRALDRSGPHSVGPGDLTALAFGQRIQLDQTQALRYLEYARVTEGLDPDILAYPNDADDQQRDEAGAEGKPTPHLL